MIGVEVEHFFTTPSQEQIWNLFSADLVQSSNWKFLLTSKSNY